MGLISTLFDHGTVTVAPWSSGLFSIQKFVFKAPEKLDYFSNIEYCVAKKQSR